MVFAVLAIIAWTALSAWLGAFAHKKYRQWRISSIPTPSAENRDAALAALARDANFQRLKSSISPPRLSVSEAHSVSGVHFRDAVRSALVALYDVPPPTGRAPVVLAQSMDDDGWAKVDLQSNGLLPLRAYFGRAPVAARMPVLVIDDEAGADVVAGAAVGKKAGRAIGPTLVSAGHAVLVAELKGFGSTSLPSVWGLHGVHRYRAVAASQGLDLRSVWVHDLAMAFAYLRALVPADRYAVVGISKSAYLAAVIALLHPEISHVYLASGFSAYETENYASAPHAYALGERLQIERVSVLAALFDRKVRLSYGRSENAVYRKEAQDRLVLGRVKRYWQRLNAGDRLTQLTHDGGHVYVAEDLLLFLTQ